MRQTSAKDIFHHSSNSCRRAHLWTIQRSGAQLILWHTTYDMTKLTHSGAEFMSELLGCHSNFKDDISSDLHPSEYHAVWQNELVEEFGEDVTSMDQSRHYVIEVPDRIDGYGRLIQGDGDYIVKLRGSQDQD